MKKRIVALLLLATMLLSLAACNKPADDVDVFCFLRHAVPLPYASISSALF